MLDSTCRLRHLQALAVQRVSTPPCESLYVSCRVSFDSVVFMLMCAGVCLQGIKLYWHVLETMLKAEEGRAGLAAAGRWCRECWYCRGCRTLAVGIYDMHKLCS